MAAEAIFRVAFWVLFAGVFVMRMYFALRVGRAGERFMPDGEAIEREGRVIFAVRFLIFFLLLPAWRYAP